MGYLKTVNWKRELKETALIALLGGPSVYFWCTSCFNNWDVALASMIVSAVQWILLWQGNAHVSNYLSYKIPWLENPSKRFIWGVVGVIVYTPLAVYTLYVVLKYGFDIDMGDIKWTLLISVGITFVISFFLNSVEFLKNWKKASLDAERLKKEQMEAKYETLKNQVNPHFLFNSLNALTNLVYEDQDQAAKFIRELSKVYRYVLDTRAQEVVSLKTEMDFVNSYLFLQKIRFDEKLQLNISIEGFEQKMLPPMAIQMLLENAIKHNVIAEEEPLTIHIEIENGEKLVVRNNLQKKNIPIEESSEMGLSNIKSRYEFLSATPVEVIDEPSEFIVKLPLLAFEK
ncbi:histidine kinase [uncultured Roseivirga sp.]|uniref:sensor histidine kinase n=1 Tax=uncultured Roseivirga sp. TaxID=543088 RepID=UPI0030DA351B|tara:strand:- start:131156 stop:132184 length:1029 start_codon:yes stop_codon:yes gene_type:complete